LDEEQKKMVQKWEEATGNVVYHVIHDFTQIGELYSLLFVSRDKEEWLADRRDINDGIALSYVVNVSYPDCSEYGSIAIRPLIGGVMRLF
jgi:site-specific recombinase